jgi:hypothetical protein
MYTRCQQCWYTVYQMPKGTAMHKRVVHRLSGTGNKLRLGQGVSRNLPHPQNF